MAIQLKHENGLLIVDAGDHIDLLESPLFRKMLLSLDVKARNQGIVSLEVEFRELVQSVNFIVSVFDELGVETELSSSVSEILEAHRQEEELLTFPVDEVDFDETIANLTLKRPLKWHQERGLKKGLARHNFAEFSVQGSGKTTTALSAFSVWRSTGEISKLVVIGPLSSFGPWEDEIRENFETPLATLRWSGSMARRMQLVESFNQSDVVLCSYDTAWRDVERLGSLISNHKTMLVLDESHYIKNFGGSARGSAALALAPYARKRWIMSGTPAPHSLEDLWTQFQFLWPTAGETLLGNQQEFLRALNTPNPTQVMRDKLQQYFHRTTQDELGLTAPSFNSIPMPVDYVSPEQSNIIRLLEIKIAAEARDLLPAIQDRDLLDRWRQARIIRLLQAASNPALLFNSILEVGNGVDDIEMGELADDISRFRLKELFPGKVKWAIDKTRELVANGQKVLIWTGWVPNIHYIAEELEDLNPLKIYGGIKPYSNPENEVEETTRENNIRLFKNSVSHPVLIANPAAAAESISLHMVCHNAIYVDRSFNCGQWLQSLNRIHRVGLPDDVVTNYWVPFIDCAVERSVDERLERRARTLFEFLGDETPAFGIDWDDQTEVSDDVDQVGVDFSTMIDRISMSHQS